MSATVDLALELNDRRAEMDVWGKTNVYGLDEVEKARVSREYALACAKYWEARSRLTRAVEAEVLTTSKAD